MAETILQYVVVITAGGAVMWSLAHWRARA